MPARGVDRAGASAPTQRLRISAAGAHKGSPIKTGLMELWAGPCRRRALPDKSLLSVRLSALFRLDFARLASVSRNRARAAASVPGTPTPADGPPGPRA